MKSLLNLATLCFVVCLGASGVARAETLAVGRLAANEKIVMTYDSGGETHLLRRTYHIDGGDKKTFGAVERESWYKHKQKALAPGINPIGAVVLGEQEIIGLDTYLVFLRNTYKGNCSATDIVTLEYYRDDKLIGEEKFRDETCLSTWFTREAGTIRMKGETFRDFPPDLLKLIVPPLLIEQRIWEEVREAAEKPAS